MIEQNAELGSMARTMAERLQALEDNACQAVERAADIKSLEELRHQFVGRASGEITNLKRQLKDVPGPERPAVGKIANDVSQRIEALLDARLKSLQSQEIERRVQEDRIDVTLPGTPPPVGRLHVITQVLRLIKDVFIGMGFEVVEGPEVETEGYNFEALNMPADHPAREMWDSFYLGGDLLLRSHTSPVQARIMEKTTPPVRVIVPGKCYRRDAVDATHSWEFQQIEGLWVDEGVTFADLKGCLAAFGRELFGQRRRAKFMPSYFPFTEPSAEMAIDCFVCEGKGCRMCKNSGWIEILGCGMVHPVVLERVGYDTSKVTGFAFGMGIERIALLRHDIDDIRLIFENDRRFLEQF